ncbi:retrovirus-related pol polyprotein from transposon TNT 1-94 [Tanacetum coccineum]|uniref:Retrovirus-related pol polyprotein from transposon TNT 1-94 n=1 Tax=Tanacetum coccineum TaxID=301880 RepID=A0ABQ4YG86_9ASTR
MNEPIVSEPIVKKPVVKTSEAKASADKTKAVMKNNGAPIIKDWVSDSEEEDMPQAKFQKKTVKPSFAKIEFVKSKEQVKSPRKTIVKQGDQNRQNTHTPRGNQRNWNNIMSQRLESNFEMINKACYVCGSFDHLQNMVPKAVLMRYVLVSITTVRPVNTAQPRTTVNSARPMINVFNKAHLTVRRPINNKIATKNSNFNKRVNTVSGKNVNAARPKAVLNVVKGNQVNAVKASACWVWKPKTKIQVSDGLGPQKRLIFLPYVKGTPQQDLKDKGVIDSGCSRHMIGNMSRLTDFEEIDGGYVAFGVEWKSVLQDYILLPLWTADLPFSQISKSSPDAGFKPSNDDEKKVTKEPGKEGGDQIMFDDEEPKKVIHALKDPSWIEAMQDKLLQFKLQKVWTLVDLPNDNRVIGTKWVYKNKKDERGIVIKNKARLVAQRYTQEEEIDYDEVFAPVARIKAIRLFLAHASFKDFVVYQMDVKSSFLYGKIEEEVYVCQPPGFEDPYFLNRVYKVEKALMDCIKLQELVQKNGTSVTKMYVLVTTEEKTNKKNDVKARSLLLMALPNEHQLTFSQYPDAKTMFLPLKHDLELMLLGINLLPLLKVNAARHKLTTAGER